MSHSSVTFRCTEHGDYDVDQVGNTCPTCLLSAAAKGHSPILLAPEQIRWIVNQLDRLKALETQETQPC